MRKKKHLVKTTQLQAYSEPTDIEKEQLRKTLLYYQKEILVWGNRAYCTCCDRYFKYDKQIKYAKVCPKCFETIHKVREVDGSVYYCDNIILEKKKVLGYWVETRIGKYNQHTKYILTYHNNYVSKPDVRMLKIRGMGYWQGLRLARKEYSESFDWRKASHDRTYENRSLKIQKQFSWENRTKKEYLENFGSFIVKSNQKKIAIDNLLSPEQLKAMVYFNINDVKVLYKYRGYIKKHEYELGSTEEYTQATLIYLSKNKIKLSDYNDYATMCKELNRKLDRPKDFKLWHDRLTEYREVKKNEKYQKGIIKQFKKLSKYSKYNIKPLSNVEEIQFVATSLHNCMARLYTEPYSKGKTELYYLEREGKPVVAIEVNNNRLIQARADHNENPNRKDKRLVNKWFKEVRLCSSQ